MAAQDLRDESTDYIEQHYGASMFWRRQIWPSQLIELSMVTRKKKIAESIFLFNC